VKENEEGEKQDIFEFNEFDCEEEDDEFDDEMKVQ